MAQRYVASAKRKELAMSHNRTPEQQQTVQAFQRSQEEVVGELARLRSVAAEMEQNNHPALPQVREAMHRMQTAYDVVTTAVQTGGDIDFAELEAYLKGR
jgi:hypothetical protein